MANNINTPSETTVYDALKILIKYCNSQERCIDCFLRNPNNSCGVINDYSNDPREALGDIELMNYNKPRLITN
jgi:hypothetical protein